MAEKVHLTLLADGAQIEGDSSETTLERENTIECVQFDAGGRVPLSVTAATGRRQYQPVRIVKPIDRATPKIAHAFATNQTVVGTFRFFRASLSDGTTEHFFTVEIRDGVIASIRQFVLDVLDSDLGTRPALEEVTFAFNTIKWTWDDGGIEAEDTWTTVSR